MIRCLITGKLHDTPQARTSATGNTFAIAKVKADDKGGAWVWVSVIAFGEQAERLAALKEGAAVAVSGRCEVSAWLNREGEAVGGLSLVVDELATLKGRPRPPRPRQPEAAAAGFDDMEGWRS